MKITVEHREGKENEVILRCREVDEEMLWVLSLLHSGMQKLCVWDDNKAAVLLSPGEMVYCESVEERTYVYTASAVLQTALSLAELEGRYAQIGYFRIGKGTLINLHRIRRLKSERGGRIEATVETGEKLLVSRHYAPLLRERLGL